MDETSDHTLLREFADRGDQAAFGRLVDRHLALVFSAARRQLSDAALAQDVAQQVFALLAAKAGDLGPGVILPGWLYRTACHLATRTRRTELRRLRREELAVAHMNDLTPESVWQDIEPELDAAMAALPEVDRDAVVLRYFQNKSLREVGRALGTSDDAAQKRLSRAIEKLRTHFQRRGRPLAASSLTAAIVIGAVAPAPPALAAGLATAALAQASTLAGALSVLSTSTALSTTSTTTALSSLTTAMTAWIKPAIVGSLGLAAATGLVLQRQQLETARARTTELETRLAEVGTTVSVTTNLRPETSSGRSNTDPAELLRLRGEVGELRRQLTAAKALAASASAARAADTAAAETAQETTPTSGAVDPQRLGRHINSLKHLGLALRILTTDAEEKPELQAVKFTAGAVPKILVDNLGPEAASLDQFEILVPDMKTMLVAERTPQSIVGRAREAVPTTDGRFIRAYLCGDGSVQSVRHATATEVYGWGQDASGNPVVWPDNLSEATPSTLVPIDPELARRYGLRTVGGK